MKFINLGTLIFIVFSTLQLFSQSGTGVVYYTDIQSLGAPGANLLPYKGALYFTPKHSLYVTKVDSLENGKKNIIKTVEKKGGGMQAISSSSLPHGLFNFTKRKEQEMISNARFAYGFTHTEQVPQMDWNITKETKKLEDILVRKATTHFRGRNYIAWFAPEIPVPLGPWKLNGLPGLILEAYDEDKEILFIFQKLEMPYRHDIRFPSFGEDLPTFEAYKAKQIENFQNNIRMQRAMAQKYGGTSKEDSDIQEKKKRYLEIFEEK